MPTPASSVSLARPAPLPSPRSRLGRAFVVVAIAEAVTWTGLLLGMLLEHVLHVTELGVTVFGPLHGGAFLLYGALAFACAIRFRWGVPLTLVALIAAVPPLTTVPMERWLRRRERLDPPAATVA